MALVEAAARGGAVALLVLIGALLLRDARQAAAGRYGGLFAFGAAIYAIVSSPASDIIPEFAVVPLRLVAFGNPALFWIFAAAAFDDEFAPSWRHALAWVGSVALGAVCAFGPAPILWPAFEALSLGFVALAVRLALVGRPADLVEERRRFRVVLVVGAALYTAVIVAAEIILRGGRPDRPLALANALGLLAIAFAIGLSRLRFFAAGSLTAAGRAEESGRESGGSPPANASGISPPDESEAALVAALRRVMEDERAYRQEGLGIAALAARLAVPEYRLRRLINQRLGHRNFSAFVNGYRLAEAEAALASPPDAATPILTIALDAGFQSIGPFNRAFKARTGLTPSEYRRQKLTNAPEILEDLRR